jgi:hypothetical protein
LEKGSVDVQIRTHFWGWGGGGIGCWYYKKVRFDWNALLHYCLMFEVYRASIENEVGWPAFTTEKGSS